MAEWSGDVWGVVQGALGAASMTLAGFVKWTLGRHIAETDDVKKRVAELEKDHVGQDRLDQTITRFENKVGEVHTRLDDIFKVLINKG